MKQLLSFAILFFVTTISYAETCPQPQLGYVFRVAAWGNHSSTSDIVRCHYYSYDNSKHIEIKSGGWRTESAFINHPKWHGGNGDHYYLCTSFVMDVRECEFG